MPRASAPPPAGGKRARHQREDPVAAWLDHLRVERGLATNTLVAYERDLRVLAAFAGERGLGVLELGPPDLADFAGALRARGLGARSQARHVFSIRGFFGFALREGLVERDPTRTSARRAPSAPCRAT